jgi:hypothetical protein
VLPELRSSFSCESDSGKVDLLGSEIGLFIVQLHW